MKARSLRLFAFYANRRAGRETVRNFGRRKMSSNLKFSGKQLELEIAELNAEMEEVFGAAPSGSPLDSSALLSDAKYDNVGVYENFRQEKSSSYKHFKELAELKKFPQRSSQNREISVSARVSGDDDDEVELMFKTISRHLYSLPMPCSRSFISTLSSDKSYVMNLTTPTFWSKISSSDISKIGENSRGSLNSWLGNYSSVVHILLPQALKVSMLYKHVGEIKEFLKLNSSPLHSHFDGLVFFNNHSEALSQSSSSWRYALIQNYGSIVRSNELETAIGNQNISSNLYALN